MWEHHGCRIERIVLVRETCDELVRPAFGDKDGLARGNEGRERDGA